MMMVMMMLTVMTMMRMMVMMKAQRYEPSLMRNTYEKREMFWKSK